MPRLLSLSTLDPDTFLLSWLKQLLFCHLNSQCSQIYLSCWSFSSLRYTNTSYILTSMIQICNFTSVRLQIETHKRVFMRHRAPGGASCSSPYFQSWSSLWESARSAFRNWSKPLHLPRRWSIKHYWLCFHIRFPWQLSLKGWWRMGGSRWWWCHPMLTD